MIKAAATAGVMLVLSGWMLANAYAAARDTGDGDTEPRFLLPKLDGVPLTGDPTTWTDRAFRVECLCEQHALPRAGADSPLVQIAWSAKGLMIGVGVRQAHFHEVDYLRHLFQGDSIELFLSTRKGSRDRYMLAISPGVDGVHNEPRHCFFQDPSEEGKDMSGFTFSMERRAVPGGYEMEVVLPWKNLNLEPRMGMELGLQIYVMQTDEKGLCHTMMWHPSGESHLDPHAACRVILAGRPSAPVRTLASVFQDEQNHCQRLQLLGPAMSIGKRYQVQFDSGAVVVGDYDGQEGQAVASTALPVNVHFSVSVDGEQLPLFRTPPSHDLQTIVSQDLGCEFERYVFDTDELPKAYLRGATGYKITSTSFVDLHYRPVKNAAAPGRYGAIVEIRDGEGRMSRRFRSLFRVPSDLGQWHRGSASLQDLPGTLAGTPPASSISEAGGAARVEKQSLRQPAALTSEEFAAWLATFYENQLSGSSTSTQDFRLADRRWWLGYKRQLYGWNDQFSKPFARPQVVSGQLFPVIHEGSPAEAGVTTECAKRLDALCRAQSAESEEGVEICLARHGVVFLHQAYGAYHGQALTLGRVADMQSMTKPLSGALMMMLVDQGLVSLDEPIGNVLPPLRQKIGNPLTIRHLYTHLNGMRGNWGDEIADTEEMVSGFYRSLEVGSYSYNSVGYSLGGKMMEAVSGETLPDFARVHLTEPLGMGNTQVAYSGHGARSTALDYAKLGQMLLNHGAYGKWRFFSEKTFDEMLPKHEWGPRAGIGLVDYGNGMVGHNAANSGTFRINFESGFVIVIVGSGEEKRFQSCYDELFHTLAGGLK